MNGLFDTIDEEERKIPGIPGSIQMKVNGKVPYEVILINRLDLIDNGRGNELAKLISTQADVPIYINLTPERTPPSWFEV